MCLRTRTAFPFDPLREPPGRSLRFRRVTGQEFSVARSAKPAARGILATDLGSAAVARKMTSGITGGTRLVKKGFRMKKIFVIGIGAGNPDYITVQAINALNAVDVFFILDKGQETEDLTRMRKDICE